VLKFLVAESETPEQRDARREHAGKSSGETYAATLEQLRPDAQITIVAPADDDAPVLTKAEIGDFDAVFVTGSPLHVYDDSPEVQRQLAFMRAVFASGTPSFGSCAGLQLAVAAAGGTVRKMPQTMEAGIARRITRTQAGRDHPLLAGRTDSWDAPAIHGDEVERLPDDATLLASNAVTAIQAAEIRHDGGIFWGVQYHPELAPREDDVEQRAAQLDALHDDPDRRSLLWLLGVGEDFAQEAGRRLELTNFLTHLVERGD
jgi:GMP synthase-like glutamine amidotransferase